MSVDSIPVACPRCGASMGRMVRRQVQAAANGGTKRQERVYLDTGSFLVSNGMTHCHSCGRQFHFKTPKSTWGDLVKRYKKALGETAV